jgi:hypothetical protein
MSALRVGMANVGVPMKMVLKPEVPIPGEARMMSSLWVHGKRFEDSKVKDFELALFAFTYQNV